MTKINNIKRGRQTRIYITHINCWNNYQIIMDFIFLFYFIKHGYFIL